MDNCLMIFSRNPELGKVKKRLAKDVGDKKALEIYKYLLQITATTTSLISAHKQVWYTDSILQNDCWDETIFEKYLQPNGDLGFKMQYAFQRAFNENFKKVVIIGSDLYDLNTKIIQQAFDKLHNHDAVVGPATDGGYYLLGLQHNTPGLFVNKSWGTSEVLNKTLKDLEGKKVFQLEPKNDIDYLKDLLEYPDLINKFL